MSSGSIVYNHCYLKIIIYPGVQHKWQYELELQLHPTSDEGSSRPSVFKLAGMHLSSHLTTLWRRPLSWHGEVHRGERVLCIWQITLSQMHVLLWISQFATDWLKYLNTSKLKPKSGTGFGLDQIGWKSLNV